MTCLVKRARMAAFVGLAIVVGGFIPTPEAASGPVNALVLSDFGDVSATVARMQALGWTVTTKPTLQVMQTAGTGPNPFRGYDVVWIPARSDLATLHLLMTGGGRLETFLRFGGVVIIADLSPVELWVDAVPGGTEAMETAAGSAAPVTIAAASHVLITGSEIGGVTLGAADLDPGLTGGRGYFMDLPADGAPVVVAQNASGPVLVEYGFGSGHVVASLLANPSAAFEDNLVRYAHALVP